MHARNYTLSKAASNIAETVICIPWYHKAENEDWQQQVVTDAEQKCSDWFDKIHLTWPDQNKNMDYSVKGSQQSDKSVLVPPFEEALSKLLEIRRPAGV